MGLLDIKLALQSDPSFRDRFPEYSQDIEAFLKDPSCACNAPLYRKIAKHTDRLGKGQPPATPPRQEFHVVNCKADELETRLKKIKRVVAAVSVARWQDEVTAVIRYL